MIEQDLDLDQLTPQTGLIFFDSTEEEQIALLIEENIAIPNRGDQITISEKTATRHPSGDNTINKETSGTYVVEEIEYDYSLLHVEDENSDPLGEQVVVLVEVEVTPIEDE